MENEAMETKSVLSKIQLELKAPKGQYNSFGKYYYRSCEDILEALKPLLDKYSSTVTVSDDIVLVGDRIYVKATATFICGEERFVVTGFAREARERKGQDESQITGTASSYARKYALNGLFLIDDNKDADTNESRIEREERAAQASKMTFSKEQIDEMKKWNDGTFTAEELAKFKSGLKQGDTDKKFNAMKAEYERRKSGTPKPEDEKGASEAFDLF